MIIANQWTDYEILDTNDGEKLERWGDIILRRPDPQIIWQKKTDEKLWNSAQARYFRSSKGGGEWKFYSKLPQDWTINYKTLKFKVHPTGFKHMGLFPEQAANWDWFSEKISASKKPVRVLNLFAYTGGATCAASAAGATEVVHVDASKGMVRWAKENSILSGLENNKIRFLTDDVFKFIEREIRRGNTYEGIIMDPPSYGRGPKGEVWKIEEKLTDLISLTRKILSKDFSFLLINCYTTGFSNIALENMLKMDFYGQKRQISSGQTLLPVSQGELFLPCGIYCRVE
ncbi:MAG: class I SAM-dependent methyltransferase [Filifactor alocis]|nr:class I SAM-dependent methyltransferase [Filifactor alocis]